MCKNTGGKQTEKVKLSQRKIKMPTHCLVKNCTNGQYKLIKWRQKICITHGVLREDPECLFGKPNSHVMCIMIQILVKICIFYILRYLIHVPWNLIALELKISKLASYTYIYINYICSRYFFIFFIFALFLVFNHFLKEKKNQSDKRHGSCWLRKK